MKKVILIMAVALSAATVNAQGLKFGVTAGLNLSTFSGDVEDAKFTPGFQAGVVVDYALTESFSIAPELLFAQRGAKGEGDVSVTYTLNYLQLPINATYKLALGDSKLLVFAGPYVGYGLSGTIKYERGGESESNDLKFGSGDDKLNPLDFGLNIGAGYQFGSIYAKAQYNLGLTSINNGEGSDMKNSNIGISVGYLF